MKMVVAVGLLLAMVVGAGIVHAGPRDLVTEPEGAPADGAWTSSSLDIDLKLGLRGFRFGSRIFGRDGYAGGAWLNGEMRRDGFSLDGRIERDGKAHNFKLNADIDEWVRRAVRAWGASDL
jgi:hypothetical protein